MESLNILKPRKISTNSTVGIFTPSGPANVWFREKYLHGIEQLKSVGFKVIEGELTKKCVKQGYRSGSPQERADEFMGLIQNDDVDFLMSTIGGYNSSSILELLDYNIIRSKQKIITGYSDITSLHMAILSQAGLSTIYGPAVVPTFGEWPEVFKESLESFINLSTNNSVDIVELPLFREWSNHFRNAFTDDWKTVPREYVKNEKYSILSSGEVIAPIVIANLNTLCALAGTKYFPDLSGKILLLEEMNAEFDLQERSFSHMKMLGVFDQIVGLIIGKPEVLNDKGAPFNYNDLIHEIVGIRKYPIITQFDCGHTHPMHSLSQNLKIKLSVAESEISVTILEVAVGE